MTVSLLRLITYYEYDIAWRKAARSVLKLPPDTHSRFLPLLINVLPFYDDICKRSASFIISCLVSDNTLVRSVTEYGIFTGRCNSVLGRNTLLCCSHFGWDFSDFVFGNIDINNTTLSRHRGLISDID